MVEDAARGELLDSRLSKRRSLLSTHRLPPSAIDDYRVQIAWESERERERGETIDSVTVYTDKVPKHFVLLLLMLLLLFPFLLLLFLPTILLPLHSTHTTERLFFISQQRLHEEKNRRNDHGEEMNGINKMWSDHNRRLDEDVLSLRSRPASIAKLGSVEKILFDERGMRKTPRR